MRNFNLTPCRPKKTCTLYQVSTFTFGQELICCGNQNERARRHVVTRQASHGEWPRRRSLATTCLLAHLLPRGMPTADARRGLATAMPPRPRRSCAGHRPRHWLVAFSFRGRSCAAQRWPSPGGEAASASGSDHEILCTCNIFLFFKQSCYLITWTCNNFFPRKIKFCGWLRYEVSTKFLSSQVSTCTCVFLDVFQNLTDIILSADVYDDFVILRFASSIS